MILLQLKESLLDIRLRLTEIKHHSCGAVIFCFHTLALQCLPQLIIGTAELPNAFIFQPLDHICQINAQFRQAIQNMLGFRNVIFQSKPRLAMNSRNSSLATISSSAGTRTSATSSPTSRTCSPTSPPCPASR